MSDAHRFLGHLLGAEGVAELINPPGEEDPRLGDVVARAVPRWLALHHAGDEARARQIGAEVVTLAINLADHCDCRESDILQYLWAVLLGRKMRFERPIMPPPPEDGR